MTRKLITWAGAVVAVVSLTLGSANVEARHCRSHHRSRCCQQTSNCAFQQTTNCGSQQATNCGNQSGCGQTAGYASTATACCTPQSTCGNVQPASGTAPPAYGTPVSAGDSVPPRPIITVPAPAPGA
jgi:hypothetical protein